MKNIILFDKEETRINLLPLTYTRPISELRVGIGTLRNKWERFIPGNYSWLTEEYLSKKFPVEYGIGDTLFIASDIIPDKEFAIMADTLKPGQGYASGEDILAFFGTQEQFESAKPENLTPYEGNVDRIKFLYDIFLLNGKYISADFKLVTEGRKSQEISRSNTIIGNPDLIFIEEGAYVEGAFLNTNDGPIYIGKNAEVMEGSSLRGPIAICDHSVVNMGTRIYNDTTIGPWCKVGGELRNVVMLGYSNKAHDGFLGNAVIGEWCNLGAGCTASNLKNDYTEIKLWNYNARRFARTGLQFCGLMMGDHSKAGINTMFNTATVLGVGVNVYGSGYQRNFLASFSEGSRAGFNDVPMQKFFDIAERVMNRRGIELTDIDRDIFLHINEMAHNFKF